MAGRIPRDFIDDLIARSDIVDIIDARVKLKKAGRNYQACCPFHNEKSPSFSVSQEKQFFYCFGCGAKGNVISFLMDFDRLEFPEAVEELAKNYGLEVPREKGQFPSASPEKRNEREQDYQVMESVARFYESQLKQHEKAPSVIDYLKSRGLSGEIVKHWGIGYAPNEWDAVLRQFGSNENDQQQLLKLKLINQNDNHKRFDFFRNRVMFPIRDKRGRVVGFGGRIFDDEGPKYLNSPETPIFHKGQELFGLYQARQANRSLERILVVEGYMDVVALSQFGISYAVAALGTATTPEHVQLLFKSTSEVICCYDGDRAGRAAAWRALENALAFLKDGVTMKFIFLPDGEDPDTMVRKIGKEAFEEKLSKEAKPLSRFFFDNLMQQHDISSIEGKAALKNAALPLIEQVLGQHQRELLEQELSRIFGEYDKNKLERDIQSASKQNKMRRQDYTKPAKNTLSPLRMLLALLLNYPNLAQECQQIKIQALASIKLPGLDLLIEVHAYCQKNPQANAAQLLEAFREHRYASVLADLLTNDLIAQTVNYKAAYIESFKTLLSQHFKQRLDYLTTKAKLSGLTEEEEQEAKLLISKKNL